MTQTKAEISELSDSLENLIAELGTDRDKRSSSRFTASKLDYAECAALYREDWIAAKVVDIIPEDMAREPLQFTADVDPKTIEAIESELERLDIMGAFTQANIWSRAFGTAYLLLNVDDGQTVDKPLELDSVDVGGFKLATPLDARRVNHHKTDPLQTPLEPDFGYPEYYRLTDVNELKIHHSRIIRFDCIKLPYDEFRENQYQSDPILKRLYNSLVNFNTVCDGSASMVYESNVDIVKIKNLMSLLQTPAGEQLIRKRFSLAKMLKSFNSMLLLDQEEDFTTQSNSFSGLPELMDRYALYLAGGSDVPATRMFGSAASGLNATGEGDQKNHFENIARLQTKNYRPKLNKIFDIMAKSMGLERESFKFKFAPLYQLNEMEQADKELKEAQRDDIYISNNVITPEVAAKDLLQKTTYKNLTTSDIENIEAENDELAKLLNVTGEPGDDNGDEERADS